jgi:hypothetical protein
LNANRQSRAFCFIWGTGKSKSANFNRPPTSPLSSLREMLKRSGVDCFVTDNLALARCAETGLERAV